MVKIEWFGLLSRETKNLIEKTEFLLTASDCLDLGLTESFYLCNEAYFFEYAGDGGEI